MKSFDAALVTELAANTAVPVVLCSIGFNTALNYARFDVPVYISGTKYTPFQFEANAVSYTAGVSADSISIEFASVDQTLVAAVLNNNELGSRFSLKLTAMDTATGRPVQTAGGADAVETFWKGVIDRINFDQEKMTIEVVNDLFRWNKRSLRRHTPSCSWPFKSIECGYTGSATWCDQSYGRCSALGNTGNYGGFRWIKDCQEKEIWWGE